MPPKSVREQVGLDLSDEEQAAQDAAKAEEQAATEEAEARPDWLPENFKEPEELARSYSEQEKELGRLKNELGSLRDQVSEFALQQQPPQFQQSPPGQYDPSLDPMVQQYQQALDSGNAVEVMRLNALMADAAAAQRVQAYEQHYQQQSGPQAYQQAEMLAAMAEQQVSPQYGEEWTDDFRAEIGQLLQQHPNLAPEGAGLGEMVTGLQLAAELVHSRRSAEAQGTQAAAQEASRQGKLLAQSATGSSGRPQTQVNPADALIEQMKNLGVQGYGR